MLFLLHCNETCIFLTDLRKMLRYQNLSHWSQVVYADGWTDRHGETYSYFFQFVSVPKNYAVTLCIIDPFIFASVKYWLS
jgi:hypothetical protein